MCFSLGWLEQLLIWIVIVAALNIVMWAVICIFVIYICFDLISCLGGLRLPRMG